MGSEMCIRDRSNNLDYKDRWDPTGVYGRVGSWIESSGTINANGSTQVHGPIFYPTACSSQGYQVGIPTYGSGLNIVEIVEFGGTVHSGLSTPKGNIMGHMPSDISSIDDSGVLCAESVVLGSSNTSVPNENNLNGSQNCYQANYNWRTALFCLNVGCGNNSDRLAEYVRFLDPVTGATGVLHLGLWSVKNF